MSRMAGQLQASYTAGNGSGILGRFCGPFTIKLGRLMHREDFMPSVPTRPRQHWLGLGGIVTLLCFALFVVVWPSNEVVAGEAGAEQSLVVTPQTAPLTWQPARTDGFGQTASTIQALVGFNERLYAGIASDKPTPVLIWSFDEESGWSTSSLPGFGGANAAVHALGSHDGLLFAGTGNPNGAQVWASGGNGWSHAADNGFGDPANQGVEALCTFNGRLFAATSNPNGAEIWAYDGQQWTQVVSSGLVSPSNMAVEALVVHNGKLYAGTRNALGAQIWSTANGDNWDLTMGDGFGESSNVAITTLASYLGRLYAAVENTAGQGGEVWYNDWSGWHLSVQNGFAGPSNPADSNNAAVTALTVHGDLLYAATLNEQYGTQIWFYDGSAWWPSSKTGLGKGASNRSTKVLAAVGDTLWAGIENTLSGAEVWYGRPDLEFGVSSRYRAITPPNNLYYDVRIVNTMGITLTNLQAFETWESLEECVYDWLGRSHIRWDIGDLAPGESREHQFSLLTHSWCQPQLVTSTVRLQGDNLAPAFAFASTIILAGPTPTATVTPSPTASPTSIVPLVKTLQQGAGGYTGALDTHLTQARPSQLNCNEPSIRIGANRDFAGLMRFDLSSIPSTAEIVSATLQLYDLRWAEGKNIGIGAYVISRTVDVCQASWNEARSGEPWGAPGCQDALTDRRPDPEASFTTAGLSRWYSLNVTKAVREWLNGSVPNNGLLLLGPADSSEIHDFASASHAQQTERPKLSIAYFPASAPTNTPIAEPTMTPTPTTTAQCPDPYEPNDGFSQAWDIGWGGHFESYICSAQDIDYYQADASTLPFEGFHITLSNLPVDYDLHVYNMAEELIASSAQAGLADEQVTVQAQAVYLRVQAVQAAYDATQPYYLDVIPVTAGTITPSPTPTVTGTPMVSATPTLGPTVTPGRPWQLYLPIVVRSQESRTR